MQEPMMKMRNPMAAVEEDLWRNVEMVNASAVCTPRGE